MDVVNKIKKMRDREIMDAINSLTDLSFEHKNLLHIFVHVTPHTGDVSISAYPIDYSWGAESEGMIFFKNISLETDTSLIELLTIEDQLIEMIAETREKQQSEVAA